MLGTVSGALGDGEVSQGGEEEDQRKSDEKAGYGLLKTPARGC